MALKQKHVIEPHMQGVLAVVSILSQRGHLIAKAMRLRGPARVQPGHTSANLSRAQMRWARACALALFASWFCKMQTCECARCVRIPPKAVSCNRLSCLPFFVVHFAALYPSTASNYKGLLAATSAPTSVFNSFLMSILSPHRKADRQVHCLGC